MALRKAVKDQQELAQGEPFSGGVSKKHSQRSEPGSFMEVLYSKDKWDIYDLMDATSMKNAEFIALAPVGNDVILLRRQGADGFSNWPHVRIRDVEIDLDKYPYLTWKLRDTRTNTPNAVCVKVLDHETQTQLTLYESSDPTHRYHAYNLKELFELSGRRTFDIKFYYLGKRDSQKDGKYVTEFVNPGDYIMIDFIRAEAE